MSHRYPTRYSLRQTDKQYKQPKTQKDRNVYATKIQRWYRRIRAKYNYNVDHNLNRNLDRNLCATKIQRWYRRIHAKYANFEDFITMEPLTGPLFRLQEQKSIYRFKYLSIVKSWVTQAKIYNPYTNTELSHNQLTRFDMEFNRFYPQKEYDEYRNLRYYIDRIKKNKQERDEAEAFQELQNSIHEAENEFVNNMAAALLIRKCIDIISPVFVFGPAADTLIRYDELFITFNALKSLNLESANTLGRRWIEDIINMHPYMTYDHPLLIHLGNILFE